MEIVLKKHKLQAKDNYTHDMLPSNRREVFFDVVKLQWRALLLLGILVLLFAMPLQLLPWQTNIILVIKHPRSQVVLYHTK